MGQQSITTEVMARRTHDPEVAVVSGLIFGEDDGPAAAEARVRDRVSTLRDSLTGVASVQFRMTDLHVNEVDELFGPETEADFCAEETFEIECPPVTVETVVSEVTADGAVVQGVDFDLYTDTYAEVENLVIQSGLERAREQVERIARTEDVVISELKSVTTSAAPGSTVSIEDELLSDSDVPGSTMNPVEVSKRVQVIYEVADSQ